MHDPLQSLPGYVLRRASAAMLADLGQRLMPLDLRPADASILLIIKANPGVIQSDIGRTLGVQRTNMNPLVSRLEAREIIARTPADGRSQGLTLTEGGDVLVCRLQKIIQAHETALMARVPAVHQAHLLPALQALFDVE